MEHFPKVSIIIPTYNYEQFIRECIDSCIGQTYKNIEIIVVDDGSSDSTPHILKEYGNSIKVISQENKGASVALNNGVKASTGEYIAWLSSDDLYLPEKIEKQINLFNLFPQFDLIYTNYYDIDLDGNIVLEVHSEWRPPHRMLPKFISGNIINGSSILMKREAWYSVGGFNEKLRADVDTFMWLNLLDKGFKFMILPETLLKYRTHPNNQSSNSPMMRLAIDKTFTWAFENIDLSKIHPGRRKSLALFYNGLLHFRYKRYSSYVAAYKKISSPIIKIIGLPFFIYIFVTSYSYLKKVRQ